MTRFALIRVPNSGPAAFVAAFTDRAEAETRLAEIEATKLKVHHTYLEIIAFDGPLEAALDAHGILR